MAVFVDHSMRERQRDKLEGEEPPPTYPHPSSPIAHRTKGCRIIYFIDLLTFKKKFQNFMLPNYKIEIFYGNHGELRLASLE